MKQENYKELVKDIRKRIRERLLDDLYREYKENIEKGLYPYEGRWLNSLQIKAVQKWLKKRDKVVFVEVILLLAALFFLNILLYRGLFFIFLPR